MSVRSATFVVLVIVTLAANVGAHHGTAPVYDQQRTVSIDGVVTQFRFINPHALMSLDVVDSSGNVVQWTVEFQGRLNLSEIGWTENTIAAGERLRVTGNPTHTGSPRMLFVKIVRSDGSELQPASALRAKEIEAVRRQRREQRPPP
jgi:hypothetical protein